jgi:hypothetical protein
MRAPLLLSALAAWPLFHALPAKAQEPASTRVHLHATDDTHVVLESHAPGSPRWTPSCTAPCDVNLPVDRDYRVTADGVRPSECLRLAPAPGTQVLLDVHPVSKKVHDTGLVLVGVGIVALIAGDVMSDVFIGFEVAQLVDKSPPPKISNELIVPGIVIAAVGVVALATGGGMYLATRKPTGVIQSTSPNADPGPTADRVRLETPLPLWHDATPRGPVLPQVTSLPIVSIRF